MPVKDLLALSEHLEQQRSKAEKSPGIPVDAPVNIQCADDTLYLAEIGSPPGLRVALGPRPAGQPDMKLGREAVGPPKENLGCFLAMSDGRAQDTRHDRFLLNACICYSVAFFSPLDRVAVVIPSKGPTINLSWLANRLLQ